MVAAFAFFIGWALPIVWPNVSPETARICADVVTVTWIAFALDLGIRWVFAPRKWGRRRRHDTLGCVCGARGDRGRARTGADIQNVGTGLWWAFATISTVGYGDLVPVTTTGRAVAVALMAAGVALLGVVTATLASWLVERVSDDVESEQTATRAQVEELRAQIRGLTAELERHGSGGGAVAVAGLGEEAVED